MRLLELRLYNFRSYGKAELGFSETQNYIFGRNWQGKSSIMDAIGYVLFGKQAFPRKIAGSDVKAEHLVREGAKEGWVELEFEHQGRDYVLKRTVPRDRANLECEGKEIATSSRVVGESLSELLGIDKDLFANIFYSEQDELRKVLEVNPEERKTFIETVAGFDFLKELKMSAKHTSDLLGKWFEGLSSGNVKTIIEMTKQVASRVDEINVQLEQVSKQALEFGDPDRGVSEGESRGVEATADVNRSIETKSMLSSQRDIYSSMLASLSSGLCPTCGQGLSAELKYKLQHQFEHLVKEIEKKIDEAQGHLQTSSKALAAANSLHDRSYRDLASLKNLEGQKNMLSGELEARKRELEGLKEQMSAYGNQEMVFNRIGEDRSLLNELQGAIEEFRIHLRSTMRTDLENAVNYFMSKFSDGDFDAQLKINDDFGFEVLLHRNPVPLFNLSGAARDILALSLRYGLYRIASKEINFLLLDEPTHHFDQLNTNKLKGALNELSDQQLIIITVHDEFSDAIGKKFRVEKGDDMTSTITAIS